MSEAAQPDSLLRELLTQTPARFVAPAARLIAVISADIQPGMSGAAVQRHRVSYTSGEQEAVASLVTKAATRREWDTLRHLNTQQQPNVPFAYALDQRKGDHLLVCMQDVGDITRPTSLEPITELELEREAAGLASIHAANFDQVAALAWLPKVDRSYLEEMLFERTWRPAWQQALANPLFVETFGSAIPRVEAVAATIVEDLASLLYDAQAQTLIHADINPSNVLVQAGRPYFIDWQVAMWGPLYLDLPHHHCTLAQAEHYRQALAARGYAIPADRFAEQYRVAARSIGLRYMWWTLEYWLSDPTQTAWVQHYLGLVTGDGIANEPVARVSDGTGSYSRMHSG
jgi:aminoglycoside phosphotransferase (APT) family kinase protein